jgi:hypothetical protein
MAILTGGLLARLKERIDTIRTAFELFEAEWLAAATQKTEQVLLDMLDSTEETKPC